MTAVLSPSDILSRDRTMAPSEDANEINYSSTDYRYWKEKYLEEADIVRETQAELDEFQVSSKELEAELESDLARTEKEKRDLTVKMERAETERDEWKAKFMSLQTTYNTTTTSLQRELDQLRQSHQTLRIQLRELEMGNDDLERNERAVSSSLADVEAKYAKALEEKILLEHELLDKATIEEECQRLKDQVRDASLEVTILKEQLTQARALAKKQTRSSTYDSAASVTSSFKPRIPSSDENILAESPPSELLLSDLVLKSDSLRELSRSSSESSTHFGTSRNPSMTSMNTSSTGHSVIMKRTGQLPNWNNLRSSTNRAAAMTRSQTVSTFSPSRLPTSAPRPAPRLTAAASAASTSSTTGVVAKSRGVQMVSEMRARVRNLEQRLHTRVPRLRMGSISGRKAEAAAAIATMESAKMNSPPEFKTPEGPRSKFKRRSVDVDNERKLSTPNKVGDTSGWVLIMEENMTPSPTKDREKERRRITSPNSSPFSISTIKTHRPTSLMTSSSSMVDGNINPRIGYRRSQSRVSGDGRDSTSTVSTTSTLPTPTSRPTSPSFLPMPTSGSYGTNLPSLRRSVGPGTKKPSLSQSTSSIHGSPSSFLTPPNSFRDKLATVSNKSLPSPPAALRASRSPPVSLDQSRIGRPPSATVSSGRSSAGSDKSGSREKGRIRSGSANGKL